MTYALSFQKNLKILSIFGFIIASLMILYIFQFLDFNSKTFAISKMQSNISQIAKINKDLEIQISKQGLISQIDQLAQESNFEKINHIDYLKIGPESVAQK